MSNSTSSSVSVNTNTTSTALAAIGDVKLYREATAEQQAALEQDMGACLASGIDKAEYLDGLATWGGDAASYLAESQGDDEPAPVQEQPASQGAQDAALKADQAKAKLEEQEQAARAESVATLQACVKAYRRGEKAYRDGLLEAGRLAGLYISQRVALGGKKERPAAVQQLCANLGMWSSELVDTQYVNRLVASHAAYSLLCQSQGLEKDAARVAYGHYSKAFALLLSRSAEEGKGEVFTLLPGLETECLAVFKQAVADGLSRDACVEKCQGLVRELGKRQAAALAAAELAAKEERIAAEQRAAAALKATREAAAEREKAEQEAKQAKEQAQQEQDPAAKLAAEQEAARLEEAAKLERETAAQKARDEEKARLELVQKQQQEHRAQQESRDADKRQAEAEAAAKVKADKAAAKLAGKKGGNTSDAAPGSQPAESKPAGGNLLASSRNATPKDAASMGADIVRGNSDPDAVLYELVASLLDTPAKDHTADDVVRTLFLALEHAKLTGPAADAVKAARLVLTRKQNAAAGKTANVA